MSQTDLTVSKIMENSMVLNGFTVHSPESWQSDYIKSSQIAKLLTAL